MPTLLLTVLSAVSFIGFGIGYLAVPHLRAEFVRYGLAKYRVPIALLQLAGGVGQLTGIYIRPLAAPASAGLATMMLVAVGVRIRIGDPPLKGAPAVAYLLLTLYLLWAALKR